MPAERTAIGSDHVHGVTSSKLSRPGQGRDLRPRRAFQPKNCLNPIVCIAITPYPRPSATGRTSAMKLA
jgi:hypothetical protein